MRHLLVVVCLLTSVIGMALDVQAGCRIRLGGCSDPCGASACGSARGCNACGGRGGCGSCGSVAGGTQACAGYAAAPCVAAQSLQTQNAELRNLVECMPITMYKVVLEPKYFTESRAVCTTEYQDEVRYRTKTVSRTAPVEVQEYRTKTNLVPKTETKTIEYSVLVPETSEKTVELTETIPVWNEVSENYTVKVPKIEQVPEEYDVKVAQLRDEQFTYTVFVPQAETQTKMQTVTNAVPVTKTRMVEVCMPTTRMQMVSKDYGHWETRVEEVGVSSAVAYQPAMVSGGCGSGAVYSSGAAGISVGGCGTYSGSCGGCGSASNGCGSVSRRCGRCGLFSHHRRNCGASSSCRNCGAGSGGCSGCGSSAGGCGSGVGCGGGIPAGAACGTPATQTVSRRVWVPNVVNEQVPVVENTTHTQEVAYTVYEQRSEQIPYECTYLVYRPETRTATRKVVDYVTEKRTRNRSVVQYVDETRTRTRRTMSYKQQTRTETIPVVSYRTEKRTKEVSFTVNVPEVQVEPYTTTRYETVCEEVTEEYTIKVPVASTKEVQVQVCRMVPRLVSYTATPCCAPTAAVGSGSMNVGGCAACGGQTTVSVQTGCAGCATPCNACQP